MIYVKANKLYAFSNYRGLKYFSQAFLFLAIGFFLRYFVMLNNVLAGNMHETIQTFNILLILMEFFLIMMGFFLLYSLVWKNFETKRYSKNPINLPVFFMYALAIIFATFDYFIQSLILLYLSQIVLFTIASIIAYKNYRAKKQKYKQYYFIIMVLFLIIIIINFVAQYTINTYPIMRFYAYITTVIAVLLSFYITKKLSEPNDVFRESSALSKKKVKKKNG